MRLVATHFSFCLKTALLPAAYFVNNQEGNCPYIGDILKLGDVEDFIARLRRNPVRVTLIAAAILTLAVFAALSSGYFSALAERLAQRDSDPGPIGQEIEIREIRVLTPKEGQGLGYRLLIENGTSRDEIIHRVQFKGFVDSEINGELAVLQRAAFEVELEAAPTVAGAGRIDSTLKGGVFVPGTVAWEMKATGFLDYEMDTMYRQHVKWKYRLTLPLFTKLPARDHIILDLLFRIRHRKLLDSIDLVGHTSTYRSGFTNSNHMIRIECESGHSATAALGDDLLVLIANPKTETQD